MKVERLLQINVALMTTIGALLLGMGQGSVWLPALASFAAVTSIVFTDVLQWLRFNRWIAHLAMVAAAVYSLADFFGGNSEQQLLAIANLLLYLQVVLLYQEKFPRVYGQLMVLSLLQVVVAAALNVSPSSGLLMLMYLLVTVSALMLFYVHRESYRFADAPPSGTKPRSVRGQYATAVAATTIAAATSTNGRYDDRPTAYFRVPHEPLAARMLGWAYAPYLFGMSLTTVIITIVLFFSIPRKEDSVWNPSGGWGGATVGFSRSISYGQPGRIRQTDEPVMRIAFVDNATGKPYTIYGEPYIRGAVLADYIRNDGRTAQWKPRYSQMQTVRPLLPPPVTEGLVRQEIVMEPCSENLAFAVFPTWRLDGSPSDVDMLSHSWQLRWRDYGRPTRTTGGKRYVFGTTAFHNGWQVPATPYTNELTPLLSGHTARRAGVQQWQIRVEYEDRLEHEISELNVFDEDLERRFPYLKQLAQKIIEEESIDPDNHLKVAEALEMHLRLSEEYTYSLDFSDVRRDRRLDPLEDFLRNHRTGHCEYFAGALAMMLRSVGIPSRIIVGFKGGDYNSVGGYYQVKQRHAHAWVEAYLRPGMVDRELLGIEPESPGGAWLRLDPTPAAPLPFNQENSVDLLERADHFIDYAHMLWYDYVLGFNHKRQQNNVYKPARSGGAATFDELFGDSDLAELFDEATQTSEGDSAAARRRSRWRWRISILAVCLIIAPYVAYRTYRWSAEGARSAPLLDVASRLARLVSPRLAHWIAYKRSGERRRARPVEFYQRLVKLLARCGIRRTESQTPREFAADAGAQLAAAIGDTEAARLPHQVVEAYYRVRFGELALDEQEAQSIEDALARLDVATRRTNGRHE